MLKCNFHLPDKIMRIKKPLKKFTLIFALPSSPFWLLMQNAKERSIYWCYTNWNPKKFNFVEAAGHSGPKNSWNQINHFQEIYFDQIPFFCNFKNGQKSIFEPGKKLKLPKMQFHEFFCLDSFLIFWPAVHVHIFNRKMYSESEKRTTYL